MPPFGSHCELPCRTIGSRTPQVSRSIVPRSHFDRVSLAGGVAAFASACISFCHHQAVIDHAYCFDKQLTNVRSLSTFYRCHVVPGTPNGCAVSLRRKSIALPSGGYGAICYAFSG